MFGMTFGIAEKDLRADVNKKTVTDYLLVSEFIHYHIVISIRVVFFVDIDQKLILVLVNITVFFFQLTLGVDGDQMGNQNIVLLPSAIEAEQIISSHTPPPGNHCTSNHYPYIYLLILFSIREGLPVIVVRRRRKTAPGEFTQGLADFRSDSFG